MALVELRPSQEIQMEPLDRGDFIAGLPDRRKDDGFARV